MARAPDRTHRRGKGNQPWLNSVLRLSVCVFARIERLCQDLEVEGQRPVFEIVQIVLDAFADAGVAAQAVDLASPSSRLGHVPPHVAADVLLELLDEMRPLGAGSHEAHLAFSTFQNCGSSSRLCRRRNVPTGVRRRSSSVAQTGRSRSRLEAASSAIVITKTFPPRRSVPAGRTPGRRTPFDQRSGGGDHGDRHDEADH